MDSDFFAAPPAGPPAPAYPTAPPRTPTTRRKTQRSWHLGAILVAIVAVAAAGVAVAAGSLLTTHETKTLESRSKAYDATIQSDLAQAAQLEQAYFAERNQYASVEEIGAGVLPGRSGTQITVRYDGTTFCLQGAHLGTKNVYYYSSAAGLLPLGQTCS